MHPWQRFSEYWGMPLFSPLFLGLGISFIIALVIWSIVWKGMALWRAARRGEMGWFVVMLVLNTAGILEILYLYVFSKDKVAPVGEKK